MKQKGFAAILIVLVVLVLGVVGFLVYQNFIGSAYKVYNNQTYNFSLSYPKNWYVSELGKDVLTSPGTYFSPEKIDFTSSNYFSSAPKGFVRITVVNTSDLFTNPKYKSVNYTSAQQVLNALQNEENDRPAGSLPYTPGLPTSKGVPKKQFLSGAISLNDIQTVGTSYDFLYWIVRNGKMYEFLVNNPAPTDSSFTQFDKDINEMTSTFNEAHLGIRWFRVLFGRSEPVHCFASFLK